MFCFQNIQVREDKKCTIMRLIFKKYFRRLAAKTTDLLISGLRNFTGELIK